MPLDYNGNCVSITNGYLGVFENDGLTLSKADTTSTNVCACKQLFGATTHTILENLEVDGDTMYYTHKYNTRMRVEIGSVGVYLYDGRLDSCVLYCSRTNENKWKNKIK